MNMTSSDIKKLLAVYDAMSGVVSESGTETFDRFYSGGGEKMIADFERILGKLGAKFEEAAIPKSEIEWLVNTMISNAEDFFSSRASENGYVFRKQAAVDAGVMIPNPEKLPDVACGHWYQDYSKPCEFKIAVRDDFSNKEPTAVTDYIVRFANLKFGMKLKSKSKSPVDNTWWLEFHA